MAIEHHTLPPDFLQGKSPDISLAPIDFTSTPLAQYKDHYAVVLDGVLSKEECGALLAAAEAQTGGVWEQAMINGGGNKQTLSLEARDCGRIIWDSPEVVQLIWNRIRDHVPELDVLEKRPLVTGTTTKVKRWKVSRLNERMRFLKYGGGQYFRPHCDGLYTAPSSEKSFFTLHLYLNDSTSASDEGKLQGGATRFYSYTMREKLDVEPKIGRILLFQQRNLLHSGEEVESGVKFTMRTDLMYEKADEGE